jgi:hypothetical protein
MGETNAYRILVWKFLEKRSVGRARRWEDNIKLVVEKYVG